MGVGAAETPHEAQKLATIALQREGGAQSSQRKEILAIDSLIEEEDDSFVQAAHIDINSVTKTLTDIESAFDTSFMVNKAQHYLMTKLIKKEHYYFSLVEIISWLHVMECLKKILRRFSLKLMRK